MNARGIRRANSQRGVALALVVWFIAGMSLLVAGTVFSARSDVRMAQLHLARAQATAAGDGAIELLLADLLDGAFDQGGLVQQRYRLGEIEVSVLALPEPWMVEINSASPELLARAFVWSGTANADAAQELARAVVQWRSGSTGNRPRRFEALEDLLDVEGMNRKMWDSMRDYIAVSAAMSGQSNGARAQQALQRLQEAGPETRVARAGMSAVLSDPNAQGRSRSGRYRVDAMVKLGEASWLRRRWVSMSNARIGMPWQFTRTEPARIVPLRQGAN
ncbi:MAG: hypothetical protein Cons2KO_06990 [Congregibacter sp.]